MGPDATRDSKILSLRPLVAQIARSLHSKLYSVSLDDLIQSGMLGAIDAVDRHDPARAPLHAFARQRIRGAMLDSVGVLPPPGCDEEPADHRHAAPPVEIAQALSRLAEGQRRVLTIRLTGRTQRETGALLGVTQQAVHGREIRAKRKIRAKYRIAA
jgi:RNA polymerase sigma factor (sigma-70 family)